jgi:hypothetical protein
MLQVHCSTIHSSKLSDILSKQLIIVEVPILYNHVVAVARFASVALIGLLTKVSGLHLICSLRKQRELLRLGLLPTISGLRLIYGKRRRWRASFGRNERMVRRQEEKRRKWFVNRAWACRSPLEERQACRSLIWRAAALPLL